ncbi:multidrug resistance protein MDR [Penicillium viridicatum]|nr:multidrug resistance protein MDR [Penicillium viridicatum]
MHAAGTITNLSPVLTLSVYTGIALHTGRSPLTASATFTTLSIISLLSSPLSNLIYSGPKVTGALECFQRIQAYLLADSKLDDRVTPHSRHLVGPNQGEESEFGISLESQTSNTSTQDAQTADLVHIYQADFGWQRQSPATLSNVNINISPASLTVLVGPVGSGKSTLLKAILGETWIRNRSIRDNICHPLPYDEEWYRSVILSTALDYDIDSLPQKEHTVIGSNGLSLSGGQRQRIAIARAVYARTKLALFDDSLSALDVSTSAHVFTHVFGSQGILRRNGTAVILATHDWKYLADADNAVIFHDGKIREQGPPLKLKRFKARLLEIATEYPVPSHTPPEELQSTAPFPNTAGPDGKSARKKGDLNDYAYYFRASGRGSMILYAGTLTTGVFSSQFTNLWVQWWAEENSRAPFGQLSQYVSIYAILATAGAGIWAFCQKGATPLAHVNRFWCHSQPLQRSRQLRHLDLESKSPLYTQFTETLGGITTIRAFGWQRNFLDEHKQLLEESQKPYYFLFVVQRWLTMVLDLVVAGVAVMLAVFSVFIPNIGPIGVSLISLITFNQQLAELIHFWTLMETSIGAITRVRSFEEVPTEDLPLENQDPPVTWPSEGSIIFQDAVMSYEPAASPILRHITLTISPGSKLGICGRTGSGKSSLILALLRMSGDVIIDGISLQSCPRDTIRGKVTVIPQEPVLFPDTVRENVAAFKVIDDDGVLRALEKVELREHVMAHGGLDAKIDDLPLSAGQRQLVCLARAITMKQKMLLLDEATSRVDDKTDRLMQQVIRQEFSGCTIIAVAHRVHTLLDFDRIAVIDEGRVVEYDTPAVLIGTHGSLFARLCDQTRSTL